MLLESMKATEMAQQAKALAAMPDALSFILIAMVEGRK